MPKGRKIHVTHKVEGIQFHCGYSIRNKSKRLVDKLDEMHMKKCKICQENTVVFIKTTTVGADQNIYKESNKLRPTRSEYLAEKFSKKNVNII